MPEPRSPSLKNPVSGPQSLPPQKMVQFGLPAMVKTYDPKTAPLKIVKNIIHKNVRPVNEVKNPVTKPRIVRDSRVGYAVPIVDPMMYRNKKVSVLRYISLLIY